MSLETFEKVCDWLPKGCDVYFAGYGEPLLHKDHKFFISELSKKDIRTSILTNGKILSNDKIRELYCIGLYKLQISVLLKYEKDKIKEFVDMIDCEFYNKTQFNLLYYETTEKSELIADALKRQGFKIYYKHIHSRGGELYNGEIELHNSPCGTFLHVTYIDTCGSLQICSNDINGKYNIGNIESITFEDLMEKKHQLSKKGIIAPVCELCDDEYKLVNLKKHERQYEQ
jgi:hypothetical protein